MDELKQLFKLVESIELQQKASSRRLSRLRRRLINDLAHCNLSKELLIKVPARLVPIGDSVEEIRTVLAALGQKKP